MLTEQVNTWLFIGNKISLIMKSRHWASTIQAPLFKTLILCFIVTMKPQNAPRCPSCSSSDTTPFRIYNTVHNGSRHLIRCETCNRLFAETSNTAMENLKTPISKVASALLLRSEGLGLRATGRVCSVLGVFHRLIGPIFTYK